MGKHGRGDLYEQHGRDSCNFTLTKTRWGAVRVRDSVKLQDKDPDRNSATCKAVRLLHKKELTKISIALGASAASDFKTHVSMNGSVRANPKMNC
jgi:hypothetical protein